MADLTDAVAPTATATDITADSTWVAIDEIGEPGSGLRVATVARVEAVLPGSTEGIGGQEEHESIVVFVWNDASGHVRRTAWDTETFLSFFAPAPDAHPEVVPSAQ